MNIVMLAEADVKLTGSGAERVLASHVHGLAARGHHLTVVTGGRGIATSEDGVDVRSVGWSASTAWRARAEVARAAAQNRADIVLAYHAWPAFRVVGAKRFAHVPLLSIFLSSWADEYVVRHPEISAVRRGTGFHVRRTIERRVFRRAARVLPMSGFMARRLETLHAIDRQKIHIVPGGVDAARFTPSDRTRARRALGLPAHARIVLSLRNLEPRMGLDVLIEAMPAVRRQYPDALAVIAGSGPLRADLETHAARLGLDGGVRFTGFVPEERLADLYVAADVFVLPTQALEGFGLVTLEALACGTPVLGTPIGATPELLRPLDTALVFPDPSRAAIADGIVRFFDRRDHGELATRARAHATRYGWATVIDALEREMDDALSGHAVAQRGERAASR
jgi:glycosyltransferase involved in cell wall biosynthesis